MKHLWLLTLLLLCGCRDTQKPAPSEFDWIVDVSSIDGVPGIRYATGERVGPILDAAIATCGDKPCTIVASRLDVDGKVNQRFQVEYHGVHQIDKYWREWQ